MNIAAAKKATVRKVSVPTFAGSWRTFAGIGKMLPGPSHTLLHATSLPAIMYLVCSVAFRVLATMLNDWIAARPPQVGEGTCSPHEFVLRSANV